MQKLFLASTDALEDKFEGSLPVLTHKRYVDEAHKRFGGERDKAEALLRKQQIAKRKATYVNCWRYGDESEAMWKLYCGPKDGVAMVTTYGKLRDSISIPAVWLGAVQYIDYAKEDLPSDDFLHTVMHKRKAFVHEQEVRLVRFVERDLKIALAGKTAPLISSLMDWNLETIEAVVVSPYAEDWYWRAVRAVVGALAPSLFSRLVRSDLRGDPTY